LGSGNVELPAPGILDDKKDSHDYPRSRGVMRRRLAS